MKSEEEIIKLREITKKLMSYEGKTITDVLRWMLGEENWVGSYLRIDKTMKDIEEDFKDYRKKESK